MAESRSGERLLTGENLSGWEPVASGESSARVFRSPDGVRFVKCVNVDEKSVLEQERDRLVWLNSTPLPGPEPLDWRETESGVCLVMSAVSGVPAAKLFGDELDRAWPSISRLVRDLHAVPAGSCPYSRGLTEMWATAQDVVARGAVNPAFLPVEQQHTAPTMLLADLQVQLDRRLSQEPMDTVICHGDLCLPNIIVNPETLQAAGFIDLGRLGRADRYADISLLLASARELWRDEREAANADRAFAREYGVQLDSERQRFYLHLDPLTWG